MSKYSDITRMKWLAEDCKDFYEILEALENRKKWVKELIDFGCVVTENSDDYIYFSIPENKVDEYCKKFKTDKFKLLDEEEMEEE